MSPRVAVIGGGVAGLATALAARRRGIDALVLEASSRVGGLVETERTEGLLLEHGADALMEAKPAGMQLVRELGLEAEIVRDGPAPRRAFVATDHGLVPMPDGLGGLVPRSPASMLSTSLLGLPAKLRLLIEPFVRPAGREETVAEFADRRFGREVRAQIVDPMMRAIYGVRADELGMAAALPHLLALERAHGSIARSMMTVPKRAGGGLVTLRHGMASLVDALVREIGDERVRVGHAVTTIERRKNGYVVHARGGAMHFDAVVLAIPAWRAVDLVEPLDHELARELAMIEHVDVHAVSLVYRRDAVRHPLDGTGHIVSDPTAPATRACTWVSAKWPDRAPEGLVSFRAVVDASHADDAELVAIARRELEPLLGIDGAPVLTRTRRRDRALPVPGLGHTFHRASIADRAAHHPGLALAGAAEGALGVPDCLASGLRALEAVAPALAA